MLGLFSGELIFGGAYHYWREFCISKWVGLDNKKSLKQSMGLYLGGLIIRRIVASEIWGAYFQEGLFLGRLIIGILRYSSKIRNQESVQRLEIAAVATEYSISKDGTSIAQRVLHFCSPSFHKKLCTKSCSNIAVI